MKQTNPGERIREFRKRLGLKQEALGEVINMSRGNISKIESGNIEPSNGFLLAMKNCYALNPDWIKTGAGDMFIPAQEYLANGFKLLGAQRFSEGLAKVLKEPEFAEVQAYLRVGELAQGSLDRELEAYLKFILDTWRQDEKLRHWLMVQLERAFGEMAEQLKGK